MACGTRAAYAKKKNSFPVQTRKKLMNALVDSHFHYNAVLLNGIYRFLLISHGKKLNWAIKSCFNTRKCDSSHDVKLH